MAAKRGRMEIIEVLSADEARPEDLYAPTPAAVVVPAGKPRRWWIAPVALAGIAAVVVGAGVLSDGSSGGDRAGRAGDTELHGDAAVAPAVLPLVPATPAGYRILGVVQSSGAPPDGRRPTRQLWATHPETSVLSSWLEITASPDRLTGSAAGDRRVVVPGGIAVLDTTPDGNMRISGPLAGGGEVQMESSGVSGSTLVELLASLRFDGDALRSADTRFGGMFRSVATDDGAPLTTGPSLVVSYGAVVTLPNKRDDFTVTVGSLGASYDETARQFFLGRRTAVSVNAQEALLGNDERSFGVQSIAFERAGLRVSVAGTAARSVLVDAAQSTHVATGAELAALLAAGPPPAETTAANLGGNAIQVAAGRLSGGSDYTVTMAGTADGTVRVMLSTDGVADAITLTPHDAYIAAVASPTMTALIAFVPPGVDGAQLVVNIGDPASPTTLSASPIDLPAGMRVAVLAFDQMDPYEAAIHTPDGRTLSVAVG